LKNAPQKTQIFQPIKLKSGDLNIIRIGSENLASKNQRFLYDDFKRKKLADTFTNIG